MLFDLFRFLSLVFVVLCFSSNIAIAITPDEYCKIHDDSEAPGTCTVCGECVVLTTNLGTHETKKCEEGGCELTENENCPEFPACVE